MYDTLCEERDQLQKVTDCIQAQTDAKGALEKRLSQLLQQVQVEQENTSSQEETMVKKEEEMKAVKSQREVLQQRANC